jgi:dihydrolipoamide dehydrogenase
VTVVVLLDWVLSVEDEEILDFARKSFEKQGIKIQTGATVSGCSAEEIMSSRASKE